ncbi:MAG: hypothetical protein JSR45_05575 [Proteobacteria bacterium]|nr:hypothetical protein [Pseudomonadota bacterium]
MRILKTAVVGLGVIGLAGAVTACGDTYYDHPSGYYYDQPYDFWYDGFYGPYTTGYWGDGGVFLYSDGHGGWVRDEGGHFRHERFEGAHGFRIRR